MAKSRLLLRNVAAVGQLFYLANQPGGFDGDLCLAGKLTDEGARHIRQTTERAKGLVNAAANLGIKIKDIYWTMGAFDAVFTADAPDDETMTAFAMSMASLGNIRTQTLRAFSVNEMNKIVAMLPTTEVTSTK